MTMTVDGASMLALHSYGHEAARTLEGESESRMRTLMVVVVTCLLLTPLTACDLNLHPPSSAAPTSSTTRGRATVTADSCLPNVKVVSLPPPAPPTGPTPTAAPLPPLKITPLLFSVAEVSPSDVWAVGGMQAVATQGDSVDVYSAGSLILHYDGQSWSRLPSPANLLLHGVAMVSPTEGWAVGETYAPSSHGHDRIPTILHYFAGSWTAVSVRLLPGPANVASINAVSMLSAQEGWAVGIGSQYHYSRGAWSETVQSGGFDDLQAVQMLSAQDGWAVGQANGGGSEILHYQSGLWTSPTVTGGEAITGLSSVSMASASDGWAVGHDGNANAGVLVHYCNGAWSRIATGVGSSLQSIRMVSTREGWAFGSGMWHYADGSWTQQALPSPRGGILGISELSSGDGWAVGVASRQEGLSFPGEPANSLTDLYLLHYQSGAWTPYTQPIH